MIEITKFKMKGDWEEIKVEYVIPPQDSEKKTVTYACKERPRNDLILAFDELTNRVLTIGELNWDMGVIRAFAFKETEDGRMMTITTENDGEYKIKTTIGWFYPSGEFLEKVEQAIAFLEGYVNGDRAQMSLLAFPAAETSGAVANLGF
jgi:hypothetical protein